VSEVNFDDADLDIRICDLMATARKSKSNSRDKKTRKGGNKNRKRVSP